MTPAELRRRLLQLLLFRVVLITLVLGITVALHAASPEELGDTGSSWLFGVVGATYALSLAYALGLRSGIEPSLLARAQLAGDLLVTTALVHLTGGAQSGYAFLFPLTILEAALVLPRRASAVGIGVASTVAYAGVSLAGWTRLLPAPAGLTLQPWDLPRWQLARTLILNGGAFAAVTFLAAWLGNQLARAGASLATQEARSADLEVLNEDIVRCLSSGLVTVDQQGTVLTLNEAAGEVLGVAVGQANGRPLAGLAPELAELVARAPARGLRRGELVLARGDREIPLGVSVSTLTDHQGRAVGRILNFQDLTELRRMEAQVRRAERLAAIGQMAAGIAHEIRNPLAAISGSIELLRGGPATHDAESRTLADIVLREVDRLNGLVTDLVDYARPRPLAPSAIDLDALAAETVRVFEQDRATKAVHLRCVHAPGPARVVHVDAGQVRQVLWNLLHNAVEAMPEGGEIVVEVGTIEEDEHRRASMSVKDTGPGIPAETLERIWEPFFTTKTRGTGLGLATVSRIVSDHGGTVTVSSRPGETRFLVELPLLAPEAAAAIMPA